MKKEKGKENGETKTVWKIKESKFVFGFEDRNRKAAGV